MAEDVQRYLDGIESQHQGKTKFMASLKSMLQKVDGVTQCALSMIAEFDMNTAKGKQQDIMGELAGVSRQYVQADIGMTGEVLDDETYRRIQQMQVVSNQWDGTNEEFRSIWKSAMGSEVNAVCKDNQDMTMNLTIEGNVTDDLIALIMHGYYVPKPMGVGVNVTVNNEDYSGEAPLWTMAAVASIGIQCMYAVALGGYVANEEEIIDPGEEPIEEPIEEPGGSGGGSTRPIPLAGPTGD